jgi:HlyD family secretion protein
LSVTGIIEIERLEDVLYVTRPNFSYSEMAMSLFKVTADGTEAVRTEVEFGRTSVTTIEVRRGLAEGDQIVLSDMKRWDDVDRLRLENY